MKKILYISLSFAINICNAQTICLPTDTAYLNINNVNACIINSGGQSGVNTVMQYEIPKGSGNSPVFSRSFWIGGFDTGGNLTIAAETYAQGGGSDFFSGPVNTNSCIVSADTNACPTYNHVWNFTKAEILDFINTGNATPYILSYPANGNTSVGQLPVLAPFFDTNNDGIYNPSQGDYPLMDVYNNIPDSVDHLHGDQCLYAIYNDVAAPKASGSPTMNLEIHAQSYAYTSPMPAINNTTIYEYKIINHSCMQYDSVYMGQWLDPDIGDATNDWVGCDLPSNMGFCYDSYNTGPYSIIGIKVLKAPLAPVADNVDNNHNGVIDEPAEELGMTNFMYYNNDFSSYGNPESVDDFYQFLSGSWKDGNHWTMDNAAGTTPPGGGFLTTNYLFPGNSDPACPYNWTEASVGNPGADKRFVIGTGPTSIPANSEVTIVYGVLWAQAGSSQASIDSLISDAATVENFYRNGFPTSVKEIQPAKQIMGAYFYPNPTKAVAKLIVPDALNNETFSLIVTDVAGKLVYVNTKVSNRFELNTQAYNKGVYFYHVTTSKGILHNGKLVVN